VIIEVSGLAELQVTVEEAVISVCDAKDGVVVEEDELDDSISVRAEGSEPVELELSLMQILGSCVRTEVFSIFVRFGELNM
jgi:hypothetical protein